MLIECKTLYGDKKIISHDKLIFRPAGCAVVIDGNKILLCKTKSTGKYWFPGGAVNLGEKIEDAIKRGVREETGIEIKVERFLTFQEMFFYYEPKDEAYQNFSLFYLCKPVTTKLLTDENSVEGETEKPRWIDAGSIKKEEIQIGAENAWRLLKKYIFKDLKL